MIEMVYKGTEQEHKEDRLKLPKNVRQIGEATKGKKVYLEDYAVTYLHQVEMAVLLGEVKVQDEKKYIFIHGAIEVEDGGMNEEVWEAVYRDARKYFEDSEIIGWSQCVPEQPLTMSKEMDKMYREHFTREDAVLVLYEPYEKEDSLFVEEDGALKKQPGYYVYYDKNKAMQEYMVDRNAGRSVEKEVEVSDSAIKSFRKLTEEKLAAKKKAKEDLKAASAADQTDEPETSIPEMELKAAPKQPRTIRFLYAASTFLVLTILVIGVTMMNNYDKIKNMEVTLADLTSANAVAQKQTEAPVKPEVQVTEETASEEAEADSEVLTENNQAQQDSEAGQPQTESDQNQANQDQSEQPTDSSEQSGMTEAVTEQPETAPQEEAKAVSAPADQRQQQASYVVKAGDTLADICKMYYGSADRLEELCQLNGITDPNTILLGQKILLP